MKLILSIILCTAFLAVNAQVKIYTNEVYTSYFSPKLHQPLYVVYKLSKGGGDCDRDSFEFIPGDDCSACATDEDYAGSGFDKGHLCNAEDEAFDCTRDELTFRYYNCVPQTTRLNRGVWKSWETYIRRDSQKERLLIICGSIFGTKKIGSAAVPSFCWKIVYDSDGKLKYCLIFPNNSSGEVKSITLTALKKRLGYTLKYTR
ncbi:MAG: DNA/RNA non-specific endonuclease [Bacteroidetes bacterium]|nr:DNA/RNA non-specific endonuclease [Bacteroidota bacterium]